LAVTVFRQELDRPHAVAANLGQQVECGADGRLEAALQSLPDARIVRQQIVEVGGDSRSSEGLRLQDHRQGQGSGIASGKPGFGILNFVWMPRMRNPGAGVPRSSIRPGHDLKRAVPRATPLWAFRYWWMRHPASGRE